MKVRFRTLVAASLVAMLAVFTLGLAGCASKASSPGSAVGASNEASSSASDASLQKVKDKGELVVGLAPFYAPFESTNPKTKAIEGFDVDLANGITQKMGVKATFKPAEWQGLLGGLEKGDYDVLITAMSKKEAAGRNVEFSEVYYELPDIVLVKKGNPKAINGKADLKDKVVGVQTGSGDEQIADKLKGEIGFKEIKRYKLTQDAMNDLKAGRIDAVLAGQAFAVEQNKVDPSFQVVGEPLETAQLVAVFPKGSTSLVEAFNTQLAAMKTDGSYDQLIQKWLTIQQ